MAEFQMDDEEEEEEKEKEEKQWKGEWNRFLCLVNEDYPRQGGVFGSVCQMYAALCLCVSR